MIVEPERARAGDVVMVSFRGDGSSHIQVGAEAFLYERIGNGWTQQYVLLAGRPGKGEPRVVAKGEPFAIVPTPVRERPLRYKVPQDAAPGRYRLRKEVSVSRATESADRRWLTAEFVIIKG